MLNFRNTSLLFCLLIVGMVLLEFVIEIRWYHYLLLIFVYSLLLCYGSITVQSNFYMKVLNNGTVPRTQAGAKQLAISFDDGPADQYTSGILQVLDDLKVPATFFCIGKNIAGREALLNKIITDGHIIGNHSYSHAFWFDIYSARRMKADLQQMTEAVLQATGLKPRLFRPPYGVTNPNLAKATAAHGLISIGWNIRSLDTVVKNPQKLLDKVLKSVKPGAIVLFHDTSETTFSILPSFIQSVRDRGYEIVRLDKMLNIAAYA